MSPPVRAQAQYTQLYFDSIEAIAPTISTGFVLDSAGVITSNPAEVIAGTHSIRGAHFSAGSYTPYLRTIPGTIPFAPSQAYRVTFRYRILTTPSLGFEVLFYSPIGGASGNFLPSVTITGSGGDTGTATLTNTLGPYSDYEARWNVVGTGAIAIDDIEITKVTTPQVVAAENAEGQAPTNGSGLQLLQGAAVVSGSSLVIAGQASIRLTNFGTVATNPGAWSLLANTTYIVEFDYHVINRGSDNRLLYLSLQPAGTTDPQLTLTLGTPLKNDATTGTFSAGAQTAAAGSYVLTIAATADSEVIIDNIRILQKDVTYAATAPPAWTRLATLPFPRLGNYLQGDIRHLAQYAPYEPPFTYSVNELETRLAFSDVISGLEIWNQTQLPDSIRRLRQLNPSAVVLPYRIAEEQAFNLAPPYGGSIDLAYQFFQTLADEWYVRDTRGSYVPDPVHPIRKMNISPFCPVIDGQTYTTHLLDWLNRDIFPSGLWDGIFLDNLFGRINPHILNYDDPALLDYDWNRNGLRDETPALSSEMTRSGAQQIMQQLQDRTGGLQLIIGNAGPLPELQLAPYVNGYVFECVNENYDTSFHPQPPHPQNSPAHWRGTLDAYRAMHVGRTPRINILEGCGRMGVRDPDHGYAAPTAQDLLTHRLALGTTLLGDGFYDYDFFDARSAPYWFDEFSVDASGRAVEDRTQKGYLGRPLSDATELTDGGVLILQEGFEAGALPPSFSGNPSNAVFVTQTAGEVLAGDWSLAISNPDHTRQAYTSANLNLTLSASTYLVAFDWRVLDTLDVRLQVNVNAVGGGPLADYSASGVVSGDSGTGRFPLTITNAGNVTIHFAIVGGGGKVAIDNVRVFRGGVGPWRRDFEKGFVLVNPLLQPHTFSAADLAGSFNRTGIRRIKGTQAPEVNSGQPVTGGLTLEPFDAIILLADHSDLIFRDGFETGDTAR